MKCPHCNVTVHLDLNAKSIIDASNATKASVRWKSNAGVCPSCKQAIIFLTEHGLTSAIGGQDIETGRLSAHLIWPRTGSRPCPPHVPDDLKSDFDEAVSVLPYSAQASAALTRRSLQHVLRDFGKTKSTDLFDQIQEVVDSHQLPESLAGQLDAVRVIGNFAAHPLKSKNTGAILPVEAHEAEWNLDVLEGVFEHYFVRPAQAKARKDALNKKLAEAGKPTI